MVVGVGTAGNGLIVEHKRYVGLGQVGLLVGYGGGYGERVYTSCACELPYYVPNAYNMVVLFKTLFKKELKMTIPDRFTQTSPEPRSTPLSVLYSVLEDAKKYEDYLQNTEPIHDQEVAEFLDRLRDETGRLAEQAEALLAQRLADGGVQ